MKQLLFILSIASIFFLVSCGGDTATKTPPTEVKGDASKLKIPSFSGDSVYQFVQKQVDFGPRVPGSEGHIACKEWLVEKFESYGAKVIEQDFTANIYTGEALPSTNIIAQYNLNYKKRILLSAHWDTRMFADKDPDIELRDDPVLGADDGGSGVAVLLEVARLLKNNPIDMGVDIVLFDAEDQGQSGNAPKEYWCLGSQHWSKNLHTKNYKPKYGVLLDMVGAKNPTFGQDEVSRYYAGEFMNKYWSLANGMGYGGMFVNTNTKGLTDDHVFVNQIANIPMFDIINQPPSSQTGFQKCWHTTCDDMSTISKRSLRIVGQVVTAALYKESIGNL